MTDEKDKERFYWGGARPLPIPPSGEESNRIDSTADRHTDERPGEGVPGEDKEQERKGRHAERDDAGLGDAGLEDGIERLPGRYLDTRTGRAEEED